MNANGTPSGELLFGDTTVVELGQYIAAPYAAELLAHGGANVISVEPVDGGPTRHNSPLGSAGDGRQYVIKARGKRSLPLRLSSPEGTKVIQDLVGTADVVISNLRPGLAGQLGISWEQLRTERASLIYAEVRGFGETGPLADVACVDIVAQAASGLMRSLGRREDGRAKPSDVMIADYTAGSLLAFGIASALRHRDRTGLGQQVSTSLIAASLTAQHRRASRFERVDSWHDELAARMEAGSGAEAIEIVDGWREEQIGIAPFFYNCYAVADGEVAVGAVAVNGARLLEVAGLDPSELDGLTRLRRMTVTETTDLVAATLSDHRADELVASLRAAGVPAAKVQFLEEAMVDPDLVAAGLFQQFEHPRLGPTTMPAPPVKFSGVDYSAATDTAPFGVHTDELLRELGYGEETIGRLVADGIVARAD